MGNPKVINVVMLGAASATGQLGVTPEELKKAISDRIPEKLRDLNIRALEYGMKLL